nr:hypothetical protein [Candidatus Sigynarchaeota archaeon]
MEYTNPTNTPINIPAWEDINFITTDLKNVLDSYADDGSPVTTMRARLARAIAEMRDEKGVEDRDRVRQKEKEAIVDPYKTIREMTLEVREKLQQAMNRK